MFLILNYCSSYWHVNVKVTKVLRLPLIIKCTWWWCTTVLSVCFFPQQCPVVIITIIIMFTQLSVFWDWKLPHHNTTHQNTQCNLECTLLWPHNNDFNRKNTVGTKSSNVHAALIAAANILLLPLSSAVCPPLSLSLPLWNRAISPHWRRALCSNTIRQPVHQRQKRYQPIVQLEVILLLLGLWRRSSSSLLVGSHVEYFSPMPGKQTHKRTHTHKGLHACR